MTRGEMASEPHRSLSRSPLDLLQAQDLRGKSVLNVGIGEGDLCLEALARGAERVAGLDIDKAALDRAASKARLQGRPVEFRQVNFDEDWSIETFDYVFCESVLGRVRNPLLLIDRLIDVAAERLVLEVPELGRRAHRALKLRWWHRLCLRGLRGIPFVLVHPRPIRRDGQPVMLTTGAAQALLREHRSVFSRVEVIPSAGSGRSFVMARRRRIDRLVVVAGPTSSGKSTLIAALAEGGAGEIAARLGIAPETTWEPSGLYEIISDTRPQLPTMVMHYDFLGRLRDADHTAQRRALLDVIGCCRDVAIVTLWTDPTRLYEQFEQSELRGYVNSRGAQPTNPKTLRLLRDYQDPRKIVEYYLRWFEFVSALPGEHLVLSQVPQPQLSSVDEWLSRHGGSRPAGQVSHPVRNAPLR
jgi:hypothetical protein